MSWRGALTLALLVAALVSGWSAWRQRADDSGPAVASQRADYVLRDFELVSLDKDGNEAFTLSAPELARNPLDETMTLQTPVFLLPDTGTHHWDVRAKTGWVSADNSEMRLRGEVVAKTDPASGRTMTMESEALDVFPDTRRASSAVLVAITQPGTTMRGVGLEADLASKRIQFKSKVQTQYVPTRR
ncbi:MAG TPA: LPS export ABC transporter periplasmic protein LptC [Luteimonas sp.]|nr:LPS export ABC transporter periplasmic protein LptC [Luteimonas sp.]